MKLSRQWGAVIESQAVWPGSGGNESKHLHFEKVSRRTGLARCLKQVD